MVNELLSSDVSRQSYSSAKLIRNADVGIALSGCIRSSSFFDHFSLAFDETVGVCELTFNPILDGAWATPILDGGGIWCLTIMKLGRNTV